MALSKWWWKWIVKLMQLLFHSWCPCTSPRPPVELCNDVMFEIFLRLPPEVLPRFSILNKQSNDIINSRLFQTTYWTQTLGLPRLCGIVYYRQGTYRSPFAQRMKKGKQKYQFQFTNVLFYKFHELSFNSMLDNKSHLLTTRGTNVPSQICLTIFLLKF
ncbi:hypothetical protein CR513_46358, partial [Mucuna pruriens]